MKGSIIGSIFGGGIVIAGIVAIGVIFNPRPAAPVINSWALNQYCVPSINFTDKAGNEDGFTISFRPQGAKNFTLLRVLPFLSGKGSSLSVDLPPQIPGAMYDYEVASYNSYGQSTDTQTVDASSPSCSDMPSLPIGDPMQILVAPLIVNVSIVDSCAIKVEFVDYNTPQQLEEDGLHIYRLPNGTNGVVVDTQPATDIGSYTDVKLSPGMYQYMVSAYQGNTEAYSSYSLSIKIVDSSCNATVIPLPLSPENTPGPITTPKKLSIESCNWEAAANVFLRKGPNVGLFDRLTDVQKGKTFPIIGQSEDGAFWAVEVSPGVTGYITKSEKYSRISGDCETVPKLTDPKPPEVIPAATQKPGDSSNPTIAQCSDGIDNDGDGLVDYNDFGSGDPGCSSIDDTNE